MIILGALTYVHGASINSVIPNLMLQEAPETVTGPSDSFTWKYEAQTVANSYDPDEWDMADTGNSYVCNTGMKQSPINIDTATVKTPTTDPGAIWSTLFDKDIDGYLANTGRVLRYMLFGYARPTISGGPLAAKKVYALSHIDFHFGSDATKGSEHTLNTKQFPMEMEIVFYDGSFLSSADAIASSNTDALVALSHFFTVKYLNRKIEMFY